MNASDWLQSLSSQRWPILPASRQALDELDKKQLDLIYFGDLANLCLSDPLLLLDLLRAVSGSRALNRDDATLSVESVLLMAGLDSVLGRFRDLPAIAVTASLGAARVDQLTDWLGRARIGAYLAKEWLSLADAIRVEDVYLAALIYNLPACLYLMTQQRHQDGPLLSQIEEAFNVSYDQLVQQFIETLPLPAALLSLLDGANHDPRRTLLQLAVETANTLDLGWWQPAWNSRLATVAAEVNINQEQVYQTVVQATLAVARHARAPGYANPARYLLASPPLAPSNPTPVEDRLPPELLDAVLRESIRHLANDLKFERVLFLLYDQPSHSLKLRYRLGLPEGHPLEKRLIPLQPASFFGQLCGKPQSIHVQSAVAAMLAKREPGGFVELAEAHEFAAMALFAGPTLAGVFYVDNARSGRPIDESDYQRFKALVASATRPR
ncbi:histidine kinase [Crenobacter oryzisoli]|uniref:histidine kinase n=1 Tax=Crenobacter oryzisoli TaxID=3056844 RepID=UPI0025AE4B17|nr:histidine kinase [Crenobacter sp. SG2303]